MDSLHSMTNRDCRHRIVVWVVFAACLLCATRAIAQVVAAQVQLAQVQPAQAHLIEIIADRDSRYKIAGMRVPEITVKAGEPVLLRVTARRAKTWNRDGSIHGFTLLRAKDHKRVDGWDLLFKPGTQEFSLTAPGEPGEYEVVCTVICSEDHEGMHMKFTVLP
jgi:heme/copper-type cytochrome/quinol oxidase subunit 2